MCCRTYVQQALVLTTAILINGCCCSSILQNRAQTGTGPSAEKTAAALAELEGEKYEITEQQALELADKIQAAIDADDRTFLDGVMAWDHLLDRATAGLEMKSATMGNLRKGVRQGVVNSGGLFGPVMANNDAGGSYDLLRVRQVEGKWRILFRMNHAGGGLNYHELLPVESSRGQIRVADAYIFATGEELSATMRRMLLPLAAQQSRSVFAGLSAEEREQIDHMPDFQTIAHALQNGQPAEALRVYHALPKSLQQEKVMLIARVTAAAELLDDDELTAGVAAMEKHYPGDACLDLMSIDYNLTKEDFEAAVASVERLDAAVGGDPMLDLMQGGINILKGDSEQAREIAETVITKHPEIQDTYWLAISATLVEADHDGTLRELKRMDQQFDIPWQDFAGVPDYEQFANSPQHRQWKTYLAQRERD